MPIAFNHAHNYQVWGKYLKIKLAITELHAKIKEHFEEFDINHEAHVEKGNKAAGGRARKHIGEIKKLVTGYRKASISQSKK